MGKWCSVFCLLPSVVSTSVSITSRLSLYLSCLWASACLLAVHAAFVHGSAMSLYFYGRNILDIFLFYIEEGRGRHLCAHGGVSLSLLQHRGVSRAMRAGCDVCKYLAGCVSHWKVSISRGCDSKFLSLSSYCCGDEYSLGRAELWAACWAGRAQAEEAW